MDGRIGFVHWLDGVDALEAAQRLARDAVRRSYYGTRYKLKPKSPNADSDYKAEQHRKASWLWSQRNPITGTTA
jgi:hypothetical protein